MHFTSTLALLSAVMADLAAAGPLHQHHHLHKNSEFPSINTRELSILSSTASTKLQALGFGQQGVPATGINAQASGTSGVWIGSDGPYVSTFTNTSPNEVILVVWGNEPAYKASFPAAVQPLVTASLAANSGNTVTLSFANAQSGAFAGIYPDTQMTSWGQISNTWGEFTMSPQGVVDVSREVYTQGHPLKIVGPDCTSDMNTCVFKCNDPSVTTCGDAGSYTLHNCAGSGAQSGSNATSGGCGWNGAATAKFTTTFS